MKLKIHILLLLFTTLLQAQIASRNEQVLKESSELVYENLQETQRLLSFVNHSNSEKDHRVLALLILSDAAYLKGDFVEVMNYLYQAEELVEKKDSPLHLLINSYFVKYYRILGFKDLSTNYLKNLNQGNIPQVYNLKSRILFEQAVVSEDLNKKSNLLKHSLRNIDTTTLFANSLKKELQLNLAEVYYQMNPRDSSDKYFNDVTGSVSSVFTARAYLEKGQIFQNLQDYNKADSLFALHADVISQLVLYKGLAEYYSHAEKKDLYKKNILAGNELENIINQSKIKARDLVIAHIENQKPEIKTRGNYMIPILVVLIILCLWGIYYYIKTKRDYSRFLKIMQKNQEEQKEKSIRQNSIPEKTEQLLLGKLEKFEKSQKFIQPDISLSGLAKSLDTNTKYLSDVINRNKGCNFNQYINEQRINYIIEKMKLEPKYLNYKMYYLAQECGFSSQSSFSTVFKSVTGISPLSFIKFLKNEIKNQ